MVQFNKIIIQEVSQMKLFENMLQAIKTVKIDLKSEFKPQVVNAENELLKYNTDINKYFVKALMQYETEIERKQNGS